jgi:hypothetical protein
MVGMAIANEPERILDSRRQELAELAREMNRRAGIAGNPEVTAEELQARMRARGIRPEDNIGSRELMRMRYGDDYQEE